MSYHALRSEGTAGAPLLLTFHGTGGTEAQFHRAGSDLVAGAHVVSPRGDVSEGGALRFFRRRAEGVYDMEDLARAVDKMAQFMADEKARCGAERVIGLGYSNGANILAATAFAHPGLLTDLVLLHPLIPFEPEAAPALAGTRVLVTAGRSDPICPAPMTEALAGWMTAQGMRVDLHWHDGGHGIDGSEVAAIRGFLA